MSYAHQELERLRRELAEANARAAEERRAREELERENGQTSLTRFLVDYHDVFLALRIADESRCTKGTNTNVDGKFYPMWILPWDDFAGLRRDHFNAIDKSCGDQQLFHPSLVNRRMSSRACRWPVRNEKAIEKFESVAIEAPVQDIFEHLAGDRNVRGEFGFSELRFTDNPNEARTLDGDPAKDLCEEDMGEDPHEEGQWPRQQSRPTKRVATEDRVKKRQTYPAGLGMRTTLEDERSIAFVYDCKAAHKLEVGDLRRALEKKKLFMEVIKRASIDKFPTDTRVWAQDKADKQVAMALTQVFDYMVVKGVAYGYLATGTSLSSSTLHKATSGRCTTTYARLPAETSRHAIPQWPSWQVFAF